MTLSMISQPENLFSPEVIFLKSGTTLRRHQIKLHSYRVKVQSAIIKEFSLRSNVINIKGYYLFSHLPVISVNVYKEQGIWRLSSKYWLNNETLYWYISNNPLIISNFSKDFVFGKFKTSRASHGWEAVNNYMWL